MNYERIRNMPTSRDGKMIYGILAVIMARLMLRQAVDIAPLNHDGALVAFLMAGVLIFTAVLALVRYDTGRPLFEPFGKR